MRTAEDRPKMATMLPAGTVCTARKEGPRQVYRPRLSGQTGVRPGLGRGGGGVLLVLVLVLVLVLGLGLGRCPAQAASGS